LHDYPPAFGGIDIISAQDATKGTKSTDACVIAESCRSKTAEVSVVWSRELAYAARRGRFLLIPGENRM